MDKDTKLLAEAYQKVNEDHSLADEGRYPPLGIELDKDFIAWFAGNKGEEAAIRGEHLAAYEDETGEKVDTRVIGWRLEDIKPFFRDDLKKRRNRMGGDWGDDYEDFERKHSQRDWENRHWRDEPSRRRY